jgi:hypothetical protein
VSEVRGALFHLHESQFIGVVRLLSLGEMMNKSSSFIN